MYQTDYGRLAEIGKEGVLALLSDSSNAENPAQVASEAQIADEVFDTIRYWKDESSWHVWQVICNGSNKY